MAAPILSYEDLGLIQGEGWLFRGLDLHIGDRDRLALIGRNGAGKTTLLKCIADLIETDEGRQPSFGQAHRASRTGSGYGQCDLARLGAGRGGRARNP